MPDGEGGPAADFGMTDLEEALRGSDREAVRAALLERFGRLSTEVAAKIREGLSPDEFARANAIAKALAAAHKVVINFKNVS